MLSQRQGDKSAAVGGSIGLPLDGRNRSLALNGHNERLLAERKRQNQPRDNQLSSAANFGNNLLGYRQDDEDDSKLPLIERHLQVSGGGGSGDGNNFGNESLNSTASKQSNKSDIERPPVLVRANSLNTNSTGDQSKYDDDDDGDGDGDVEVGDENDYEVDYYNNGEQDERQSGHDELENDCHFAARQRLLADDKESAREVELALNESSNRFIVKSKGPDSSSAASSSDKKSRIKLARQESIFEREQEQADTQESRDEGKDKDTSKARKSNSKDKDKKTSKEAKEEESRKSSKEKKLKRNRRNNNGEEDRNPSDDDDGDPAKVNNSSTACCCCRSRMFQFLCARKKLTIPLLILVIYSIAIYCLPFIEIEPKIPNELPSIPFDFERGPLKASSASAFKVTHLFKDQLHAPESLAFDSLGNCYMAVEGGFVLYAHLNKSSPIKRAYLDAQPPAVPLAPSGINGRLLQRLEQQQLPDLVKIGDLNGLRPIESARTRPRRDNNAPDSSNNNNNNNNNKQPPPVISGWRRECQLDEKIYGPRLYEQVGDDRGGAKNFKSNVRVSRCSKPLGVRLSRDESSLYVIDTLSGLYRVDLRQPDVFSMSQRQVTKLIDFKVENGRRELEVIQLAESSSNEAMREMRFMNVSLKALDDLVIDRDEQGHDLIYMTIASQQWPAVSYLYDALEGRPSGLVLRYNTSDHDLVVLDPNRLAHVRTSSVLTSDERARRRVNESLLAGRVGHQPSILMGAPRLDENDVFDDRPLNFPNGLELTGDGQALLIADTSNKRIIRHFVRGPRRGSSELWAWTPMYPDNIRRGYDKRTETYWVVGCGKAPSGLEAKLPVSIQSSDIFTLLRNWPRVRKFLLKNIYFFGYLVESIGANLIKSNKVQDVGYELRTGSSLLSSGCAGMMIIQYNQHGDIIRSIHSREFPNDLYFYSQVNELMDPSSHEHMLYLGSPSYNYLTRLVLPTETHVFTINSPPNDANINNDNNNHDLRPPPTMPQRSDSDGKHQHHHDDNSNNMIDIR